MPSSHLPRISPKTRRVLAGLSLALAFFASAFFWACRISEGEGRTYLTLLLDDSLTVEAGHYDTLRIDLQNDSGNTLQDGIFIGPYHRNAESALVNIPLDHSLPSRYIIAIRAYKEGRKKLEYTLGIDPAYSRPRITVIPISPVDTSKHLPDTTKTPATNRPPKLASLAEQRTKEGEMLSLEIKAEDPDGDSLALSMSGLPEGASLKAGILTWKPNPGQADTYILHLRAFDGKDSDTVSIRIQVDKAKIIPVPELSILSPAGDTVVNRSTFMVRYSLNQAPLQREFTLKTGRNPVIVDTVMEGKTAADTVFITLDTLPPLAPKVGLNFVSPTNQVRPTWTWVAADDDSIVLFRYKLDNVDLSREAVETSGKSFLPFASQGLSEGTHVLYVQAKDAAGNWSAAGSASILIDITPPKAPVFSAGPPSPLNSLKPKWSWASGGEGGSGNYRVKVDDAGLDSGAALVGGGEYQPPENLSEGVHTLYVQERDKTGNWSVASSKTLVLAVRGALGRVAASVGDANQVALALSSKGQPVIAFADGSFGHKINVMRWNGEDWENIGRPNFSADGVGYTCLALDSKDIPYVGFNMSENEYKASVMRWTGKEWEYVGDSTLSNGDVEALSIVLDDYDFPFLAYTDMSIDFNTTVRKWNGLAWQTVGDTGFSPGPSEYIILAVNSKGFPYLVFSDGANDYRTSVMRWNGKAWENLGLPGFATGAGKSISIRLDPKDVPYTLTGGPYVKRWDGLSWENVGAGLFYNGAAQYFSLAIDSTGRPWVAFRDDAHDGKCSLLRWDGNQWENVGPPGFSAGKIADVNLEISKTGVPFVAFRDAANGDRFTVMKVSFDP